MVPRIRFQLASPRRCEMRASDEKRVFQQYPPFAVIGAVPSGRPGQKGTHGQSDAPNSA